MTTTTTKRHKAEAEELLSSDDAAALLADLFFIGEPVLALKLGEAWNAAASRPSVADIAAALGAAGMLEDELLALMRGDLERFVNDDWRAVSASSFDRAADRVGASVGRPMDREALRVRERAWLDARAGELITSFTASQRESLARALKRYHGADLSNAEIARSVRGIIALDPRSAAAVLRHRKRLEAAGELSPAQIERAVRIKARNLRNLRARRIVDTELARAANASGLEAVKEALAAGLVKSASKVWTTSENERVCKVCGPLHDLERPLEGTFPGGFDAPPAHVSCRCVLRYTFTPAEEP